MTNLAGKRILITGATGALGTLIADTIVAEGGTIVQSARNTPALAALASRGEVLAVDMAIPGAGAALVNAVVAAGPLDGIVCAHGVVAFGPAAELTTETIGRITNVNLTSVIEIVASATPALRESAARGSEPFIVTISGVISEGAVAGMAAYGSSKSGLRAFTESAARELRRDKIRVVDTRPPHTETGLATRAIAGTAPQFPTGLDPRAVAERIVRAIRDDEKDVPASEF